MGSVPRSPSSLAERGADVLGTYYRPLATESGVGHAGGYVEQRGQGGSAVAAAIATIGRRCVCVEADLSDAGTPAQLFRRAEADLTRERRASATGEYGTRSSMHAPKSTVASPATAPAISTVTGSPAQAARNATSRRARSPARPIRTGLVARLSTVTSSHPVTPPTASRTWRRRVGAEPADPSDAILVVG
jgi:hypothetical protein